MDAAQTWISGEFGGAMSPGDLDEGAGLAPGTWIIWDYIREGQCFVRRATVEDGEVKGVETILAIDRVPAVSAR